MACTFLKKLKTGGLSALLVLPLFLPNAFAKENAKQKSEKKKDKKIEWNIVGGYDYGLHPKNPLSGWYEKLDQDFRNGKYSSGTPISDWKQLKGGGFSTNMLKVEVLYKVNKKLQIGPVFGYGYSINYYHDLNRNHNIDGTASQIEWMDSFDAIIPSIGGKLRRRLIKGKYGFLDGFLQAEMLWPIIRGSSVVKITNLSSQINREYIGRYSENGPIPSFELGLEYCIPGHYPFRIGASAGYIKGAVRTSGEETIQQSNLSGFKLKRPFNPELNFNSTRLGLSAKVGF